MCKKNDILSALEKHIARKSVMKSVFYVLQIHNFDNHIIRNF